MGGLNLWIAIKNNIIYFIKTKKTLDYLLLTTKDAATLQNRCSCDGVVNTPSRKLLKLRNIYNF